MKVKVMGRETMVLDKETVDLRYVEQLADSEQTAALAYVCVIFWKRIRQYRLYRRRWTV